MLLMSCICPSLLEQVVLTARPYMLQSSAVVVFEKPATRQKVLNAAQAQQVVQLKLQEPEQAYGLKGTLQTLQNSKKEIRY